MSNYLETKKFLAALQPGERVRLAARAGQPNPAPFVAVTAVAFPSNPINPRVDRGQVSFATGETGDYPIHTIFELDTPYELPRFYFPLAKA